MKFYLIAANGKKKGMAIPISIDLFLLGSDNECQIRTPQLGAKHAALVTREKKVFVRDLDSGEPTTVNGSLVPPGDEWPLHAGDRLEVGPLEFVLQIREKALSQKDLEEWAASCLDHSHDIDLEENELVQPSNASEAAAHIIDRLQVQRGLIKGRLRIALTGGFIIIRFNDSNLVEEAEIALVKKELCDHLSKPNMRVVLDCKNVKRMSSAAAKMFGELFVWLKPWGSKMALCRVRADLQGILGTLKLHNIPLFADKHVAMQAKW